MNNSSFVLFDNNRVHFSAETRLDVIKNAIINRHFSIRKEKRGYSIRWAGHWRKGRRQYVIASTESEAIEKAYDVFRSGWANYGNQCINESCVPLPVLSIADYLIESKGDIERNKMIIYKIPMAVGYNGCGHGWAEIEDGEVKQVSYSRNPAEIITEQNVDCPADYIDKETPRVLSINGNKTKYAAIFSCWQAILTIRKDNENE